MTIRTLKAAGAAIVLCSAASAAAQTDRAVQAVYSADQAQARFAQFAPKAATNPTRIDYESWDEALRYFVFRMGRSIREGAPRVDPEMGSRMIFGHDSRYRLEGNRVAFSLMEPEVLEALTEYRADLERIGATVDIQTLSRNEQLAYWINLHNVAVIEQIALAYPVTQPSQMTFGDGGIGLDNQRFISVDGVQMSPKDIRTKIVFPNWQDPKVIYGFFRGEIGGPTIQAIAFNAQNVDELLARSGREFVNSLRGTQRRGRTLEVSQIYDEARPFYFNEFSDDLKGHLAQFSGTDVKEILAKTTQVNANVYERDISDLMRGETSPIYTNIRSGSGVDIALAGKTIGANSGVPQVTSTPPSMQRLFAEQNRKFEKIMRNEELMGRVIVVSSENMDETKEPAEVK